MTAPRSRRRRRWIATASVAAALLAALTLGLWWTRRASVAGGQARGPDRAPAEAERAVELAEVAIVRMNLTQAEQLLGHRTGALASRARARLAIYRADCEGAALALGSHAAVTAPGARDLLRFANNCAGATVGGHVMEDRDKGIWIRFQDRADEVLFPFLLDAIDRARTSIERDLGSSAPRPLRLDLVRDSFSLSAVSDLPLEAADTTGTVAVARFGRVTMLSPRALARGYPWQDTLAHEITHLVLSRATAERAPLWLQEGVAKRQETRWRAPRPFDRSPDPSLVAYRAERDGKAVGVDRLGPSIALLPSPEAAGVAFAEVTSFVDYWLGKNGDAALPALLRDLDGGADPDAALRAVSGLGLADWQVRWRHELAGRFAEPAESHALDTDGAGLGPRQMAVVQRLVELLFVHGFTAEARERGAPDLERAPRAAALVFLVARAALAANEGDWGLLVPPVSGVDSPHGGYLATLGHKEAVGDLVPAAEPGDPASISHPASSASRDPEPLFAQALALDPLLPEVACEGVPFHGRSQDGGTPLALPGDAARRRLCEHTRSLPVRGAE